MKKIKDLELNKGYDKLSETKNYISEGNKITISKQNLRNYNKKFLHFKSKSINNFQIYANPLINNSSMKTKNMFLKIKPEIDFKKMLARKNIEKKIVDKFTPVLFPFISTQNLHSKIINFDQILGRNYYQSIPNVSGIIYNSNKEKYTMPSFNN